MKKITLALLFIFLLTLSACTKTSTTPPNGLEPLVASEDCNEATLEGGWTCVWADEFEGDTLDLTKWNYETGGYWFNNEIQYYTNQNTSVSNSVLSIIAKHETFQNREYTSSRITTQYKADFTYGRFIIRAKNPIGGGTWPAIWMMPTMSVYGGWPKSGEIDIMEYVGNYPTRVSGTIHTEIHNGGDTPVKTYSMSTTNTEFHNYELIWLPGKIQWFVDGVKFNEVNYTPIFNQAYTYNQVFPFDQKFFMILNLAIGGTLGGTVDPDAYPTAFEIDYVRAYQLDYATLDTEKPEQVKGITLQQLANSIYWTVPADDQGIEKYRIFVDGQFKAYSNLNQYTFKNLTKGQSYTITIEALDFTGRVSSISDSYVIEYQ